MNQPHTRKEHKIEQQTRKHVRCLPLVCCLGTKGKYLWLPRQVGQCHCFDSCLTLRGLLRFLSFIRGSSVLLTTTSMPWLFIMALFFLNLPMMPCSRCEAQRQMTLHGRRYCSSHALQRISGARMIAADAIITVEDTSYVLHGDQTEACRCSAC